MAKATALSEDALLAKVESKAKESVGWYDSRLSKERQRVLDYYNGRLPKRQHEGRSSYVSSDVYDAVEMMKAQLLETYASGDEIATFDPDQEMSTQDCRAATAYARYVIFQQNQGYKVWNDVIHDGLTARVGIAKLYWDEREEFVTREFNDQPEELVQTLAGHEDVDAIEAEQDEATGLYSGYIVAKADTSQIALDTVPPEEFLIEARAVSIEAANYVGQRTRKTRAQLYDMGYDRKKVDSIGDTTDTTADQSPERIARDTPTGAGLASSDAAQDELETLELYESYVRLNVDGRGVRRWCIVHAGGVVLEKYQVDRAPFFPYVPLPIPHSFFGNNYAARVMPTQNARTVLTRAVLDHAAITNNPRYAVVQGGLLNPREMLDNRLGGLVNVKRPDSVVPLQQAALNPFTFEILKQIQADREETTGISALSQGLNKDAISKQNSQGLVGDLVAMSSQRQKIAARNFAYNFLVPIYMEVIRLAIENEKKDKIIEVAGNEIRVSPRDWTERKTCTVSMHLGYGERDQAVQKRQIAYQGLAADPMLGDMFGRQERFALIRDTLKLAGMWQADYLKSPDKAQQPQPDPLKVKELQIKEMLAQAAVMQAKAHVSKDQRLAAVDASKVELAAQQYQTDTMFAHRDAERHDAESISRIDIADREMEIEENLPDSQRTASINP